jgi:hypothetical protein
MSDDQGTLPMILNYFGISVASEYLERLADGNDHASDWEFQSMQGLLGVSPAHVPREVLERYVEVSPPHSYLPIFPRTDKIFERILGPLRSAKRCYCFGEYLATIELCAHLGEMFAILLWQMRPLHMNGEPIGDDAEAQLLGTSFERQRQDRRIKILQAIGGTHDAVAKRLDDIRRRRRKYFHLWSEDASNARADALHCFWQIVEVAGSVLQIGFDNGRVVMNPALRAYVQRHRKKET